MRTNFTSDTYSVYTAKGPSCSSIHAIKAHYEQCLRRNGNRKKPLNIIFYPAIPSFNVIMQNWVVLQLLIHYHLIISESILPSKAGHKKLDVYKKINQVNYISL